jgi:hypothetical protein
MLSKNSPLEIFTGKQSKLYNKLVEFGRIGQVPIRAKFNKGQMEGKVTYRAILVGWAKNHSADTYRMYNPVNMSYGWIGKD